MFPDLDAGQVAAATAARWDLSGPLPVARPGWLACPVCHTDGVQVRHWRFHERSATPTVRWRCDVSMKCCDCGAVWVHGVALTDEAWERREPKVTTLIQWRRGLKLLEERDS